MRGPAKSVVFVALMFAGARVYGDCAASPEAGCSAGKVQDKCGEPAPLPQGCDVGPGPCIVGNYVGGCQPGKWGACLPAGKVCTVSGDWFPAFYSICCAQQTPITPFVPAPPPPPPPPPPTPPIPTPAGGPPSCNPSIACPCGSDISAPGPGWCPCLVCAPPPPPPPTSTSAPCIAPNRMDHLGCGGTWPMLTCQPLMGDCGIDDCGGCQNAPGSPPPPTAPIPPPPFSAPGKGATQLMGNSPRAQ
jgi:hypothetical protein